MQRVSGNVAASGCRRRGIGGRHTPPNQRMKLSWRGGRLKGNGSILIAAADHAAYARFVRPRHKR
jgi:hypothetical protein